MGDLRFFTQAQKSFVYFSQVLFGFAFCRIGNFLSGLALALGRHANEEKQR